MIRFVLTVGVLFSGQLSATALSPFIDIQQAGLTLSVDGKGLASGFTSTNLTTDTGGALVFALLYWNGVQNACGACSITQPYGDQLVTFNGNPLTGTVTGNEVAGGNNYVGYFADVTGIVNAQGAGVHSYSFADGDAANNLSTLDGVGLIEAYTNASDPEVYRVLISDGLDFMTSGNSASPVTFNHGSMAFSRTGTLYVFAGGGTAAGTDQINISNNPSLVNALSGANGAAWDSLVTSINIPSGVGTTTVSPSANTDQIAFQVATLRLGTQPAVPEPGTIALCALGLAGLWTLRRRA